MKKLSLYLIFALTGLFFGSCSDDYTDWADPQSYPQEALITVPGLTATGVNAIDLATQGESTSIFTLSSATLPDGFTLENARVDLTPTGVDNATATTVSTSIEGVATTEDLQNLVTSVYGFRPTARTFDAHVYINAVKNGQAVLIDCGQVNVVLTPEAPFIDTAYYITGGLNGWNNSDATYKLTNSGADVYEDPVFKITLTSEQVGDGFEFKLTPATGLGGDWSQCVTAATDNAEGKIALNNAGGNLKLDKVDGAKIYKLSFNMLDLTYTVETYSFNQFVYFIGATDGWSASDQKLETMSYDGVYTGYLYVADPNGWGLEFKFQKVAGSWDEQYNSNNLSSITGDFEKGSDNIKATAGEGLYYVTLDVVNTTLHAVKINNMNLVGDFNGWNAADDAQQMTWDATNYCYVITNAGVTANGWKFTTNNSWDINLGGTIDNLVANGDNLTVTGTTIKLYPTRKTSEKIYCTVE